MGEAAGHKFGQFIGEFCESAVEPLLQEFADKHGVYLDKRGKRPARSGIKVRWLDSFGNGHDLDYVLEMGGSSEKVGTPIAFIESAWRRYTKHSRNKAQEIQGAILPIAQRHHYSAPMLGCILAGVYTSGALEQLRSVGFKLLYFPYDSVVEAFRMVGVDVRFNESTTDADFEKKLRKWRKLTRKDRLTAWESLLRLNQPNVDEFISHLEHSIKRLISSVRIIPLHGSAIDCVSIAEAMDFVEGYDESGPRGPLVKYEVEIRYDNGDRIRGEFQDRASTLEFLASYRSGQWTPALDVAADKVE